MATVAPPVGASDDPTGAPSWTNRDGPRRLAGVGAVLLGCAYLGWIGATLNPRALWLSALFGLANAALVGQLVLALVNNWHRTPSARPAPLPAGGEPFVAVLVPTRGEPVAMLAATLRSVLDQDWPHHRLAVLVGDDAGSEPVRDLVTALAVAYPAATVAYLRPPPRGDPRRRGVAKAGNLNALLDHVSAHHPDTAYLETRDADDLVGDPRFLRRAVGHLEGHPDLAYLQTVKDAVVSPGDPFGNRHLMFYRGVMFSRDAAGAVPPCGSGLVWRRTDLAAIGGFPTWSVVEDVYSGYLAWRSGRRGGFAPVLGAVAQIAPEDLPNLYRQLGTWALDTLRIFLWRCPLLARELPWRQRLHLVEPAAYYLAALPTLALILAPALCLLIDERLVTAPPVAYAAYTAGYLAAAALFTRLMGNGSRWSELLRGRQMFTGLAFVFAWAGVRAVALGPNRTPPAPVTRKVHRPGFHLSRVIPQVTALTLLLTAVTVHLRRHVDTPDSLDLGALFWACWHAWALTRFVTRAWYGVEVRRGRDRTGGRSGEGTGERLSERRGRVP